MKRTRFTEQQIAYALRQAEAALAFGTNQLDFTCEPGY